MTQDAQSSSSLPTAERQVQDLHVILDVARALAAATGLDELLALILDSTRKVLTAERATLFLYDAATNELFSKIAHGTGEIRFPADRGIAGAAVQSRRTINIPDAYADSRFNREVDRQTGYHTRCLLTMPLKGFENQTQGALQVLNKIGGVFTTYDEYLAEALAAQVGVALQRARLMEHYVEKKQLEHSLTLARSIQQNLLPKRSPQVPGYDIAGRSWPAEATGGDYFDFLPVGDRLAVTIADATGHGIGPALEIAETRAVFRALFGHVSAAGEVLKRANATLCEDLTPGRFVTVFLGVLDPISHRLDHASAGHGPLLWYNARRREITSTGADGLPLGVMDPLDLSPNSPCVFEPGDMGIFLTDGFIEAQNAEGKFFGQEPVERLIVEKASRSALEIITTLENVLRQFIQSSPQLDDWTAVIVKRLG